MVRRGQSVAGEVADEGVDDLAGIVGTTTPLGAHRRGEEHVVGMPNGAGDEVVARAAAEMKAASALRAASQAMSTPESPAPTIKTRLPESSCGLR